jgi:hypothetical protein
MYLLDFARVFPPESPPLSSPPKGCHLYRLLRGELVKEFGQPLSSDAFSGFGRNNLAADRLVRSATLDLYRRVVPRFAGLFQKDHLLLAHPLQAMEELSHYLHRAGLNCRFLGRVRHDCSEAAARAVLLAEMLARTIKRQLWHQFRTTQEEQALPSEEPYVVLCVDTLNQLLEEDPQKTAELWFRIKTEILDYFGKMSLEPWELSVDYDLRRHCKVSTLV